MNYRHVFHAGNFADMVKHVVLTRIVEYLKRKDKAFRIVDSHAGTGVYDLSSDEAQRTGEWKGGIGRMTNAGLNEEKRILLRPFLDCVDSINEPGEITRYPGSPMIARHLLRKQDRLTAIELHSEDLSRLKQVFAGDHQVRVIELDGWLALGAHLPPKEKRGLVLVDPPFEKEGEFDRMVSGLRKAYRRWPGGIYAFWYPIKNRQSVARFRDELANSGIPDILDVTLEIRPPSPEERLDGCGMVIVNPPYILRDELETLFPFLAQILGENGQGRYSIDPLTSENAATS